MRVLVAAPYFYDPTHPEFSRTSSGFGYMVKDILDSICVNDQVFVFTHQFSEGYKENFTVLKHTKGDVLRAIKLKYISRGIKDSVESREDLNTKLHYLYYQIDSGAFDKAIMEVKPDIVHIHGLTYQTKPFIEICIRREQKFVVTLHGLNGINETVMLPEVEKEYERSALEDLSLRKIPITVISSGIRKKIENNYGIKTDSIMVIPNGTKVRPCNISKKTDGKYEILCVGSISYHKNQTQLLDAIKILPDGYKNRIHVTFVGVDSDGIDLNNYIQKAGLEGVAEYIGFVPREQMSDLWKRADLNAVMSKEEGFGLSMIEGFMYGVPTLTFYDLDAIEDIFNSEAMEIIDSRDDESVKLAITRCVGRKFDKEKIVAWGSKFSMDEVGLKYSKLYIDILRG